MVDTSFTLTISASADIGKVSYAWYRNDEAAVAGTSSALTVKVDNTRSYYYCVISDEYGHSQTREYYVFPVAESGILTEAASVQAGISAAGTFARFSFVPGKTGIYRIYSAAPSGTDTRGTLMAADGTVLYQNDDEDYEFNGVTYDNTLNFGLWHELTAGQTYYVAAGFLSSSDTGSYPVTAVCMKETCAHTSGVKETIIKKETCAATGVKTYTCGTCGAVLRTEVIAKNNAHVWSGWTRVSEATVFAAAKQTRTCSVCKITDTQNAGAPLTPTITLNAGSLTLNKGQSTTALTVSGLASGDSVKSVKSNKTKILKVVSYNASGSIKLKAQKQTGTAKLTVTLASGLTKTIKVKVQNGTVATSKISGLSKKLTLKKGGSAALKPVIAPITSQQKVTYSTSNKKVATVTSKGVIKARKKGKAKITVTSGSKKFVITVTVKAK